MNHSHSIIVNDGVAEVKIIGDGGKEDAQNFIKDAEAVFEKHPGQVLDAVIDMTESGESTFTGAMVYKEFLKHEQLGRLAFVLNDNEILKTIVKLVIENREKESEIFGTLEEANDWIRKK